MGSPKTPQAPKPLPPIPTEVDPAVVAAVQRQKTNAAGRSGRNSTLLTSPQGVMSPASGQKKTLLGT